jgi:peptidyl-prolyl cis-trans isomerase B (cyclophilin B)|tara:strand:+ start:479 stop:952 length:474 start_codon:yes stop_codon:yes gene_type:complete
VFRKFRKLKYYIMKAKIETKYGTMLVEFFNEDAPKTVQNFIGLAKQGFYKGLSFHRVLPGFVIQGGCPQGTGAGGPGYNIDCELEGNNQYHDEGILSMAHAGPNTGGSQFFICHSRQNTQHLDKKHTCFGKVMDAPQYREIIPQIQQGDTFNVTIVE